MTRTALVTGGTRGIGAAISCALQRAGHAVAAGFSGRPDGAEAFARRHDIPVFGWDVADADACTAGVARVTAALGPIDILVNNAGITDDAGFHKMSVAAWRRVLAVDLDGPANVTRAVYPGMRQRGWGRIVNISSINGQQGQFGQANYAAAKAGLIGFTKALALEGASHGVTVNAVAPGYVDTDMVRAVAPAVLAGLVAKIPVGRLGQPDEIARCIVFLVAEDAGFITGSTLSANGGMRME
jgi:acetoacetyl-CoA reductase